MTETVIARPARKTKSAPAGAPEPGVAENLVIKGDLSGLSEAEKLAYYNAVCQSLGLNPLTQPFDYIELNRKLKLYAKKDATDQLRSLRGVSVAIIGRELDRDGGVYSVYARATLPDGRSDESCGAVSVAGLKGEALANAIMKAETKSKRRVTLSICGLGFLDETEIETIPGSRPAALEHRAGSSPALETPAPTISRVRVEELHALCLRVAGLEGKPWKEVAASAGLPEGGWSRLSERVYGEGFNRLTLREVEAAPAGPAAEETPAAGAGA